MIPQNLDKYKATFWMARELFSCPSVCKPLLPSLYTGQLFAVMDM